MIKPETYNKYHSVLYPNTPKMDEKGTWLISGESSNQDFTGSHFMPILGYFVGTYEDAVKVACNDLRFETLGFGGSIKKISEIKYYKD